MIAGPRRGSVMSAYLLDDYDVLTFRRTCDADAIYRRASDIGQPWPEPLPVHHVDEWADELPSLLMRQAE